MAWEHQDFALFIGLDVGKSEHHATALTHTGEKVYDKPLPNDETRLRELFTALTSDHGPALVVVDQPATIGALPVAVAQATDAIEVAYLPGLTMRRMADLHAGSAKTDARDAFIIAETARTMPAALRSIAVSDEQVAELAVLAGFDDDLLGQMTATRNRLRGLLTQIHPALERAVGPHLHQIGVLDALVTWPTPQRLKTAGRGMCATGSRSTTHDWPSESPRISSLLWMPRPWWSPAPKRQRRSCRSSPNSSKTSPGSGPEFWPRSRLSWRPTLFTGS